MKLLITLSLAFLFLGTLTSAQFLFGARTCLARCNRARSFMERFTQTCSCESSCEIEGNCCRDYRRYCSQSCNSRCGSQYHPLFSCQCHDNCTGDSCCLDYETVCVQGITTTQSTTPTKAPVTTTTLSTTPLPIEIGFSHISNREIVCPPGIPFISCLSNPCEEECEKHPDAICLVNECGTCEAKYFDLAGNILNCYDPEKYCSDGQRIFDCGGEDLCAGTSCPGFPRAICVPNKCGGCYYDFVDGKGNIVDCEIGPPASPCGPGVEMLECSPPPCAGQTCAADITAKCRNIRCGECRAVFYDTRGTIVDCDATEPAVCHDPCKEDPCLDATCPSNPNAECLPKKTTRCGECEPSFTVNGRTLRDIDCTIPNACREKSACERNPCQMYTCPGRQVICIAQYCNGCHALFFDIEGRRLRQDDCYDVTTLDLRTCPDGKPAQICSPDLCMGRRCGSDHNPNCKPDECNNCKLRFYDDDGNEIDCDDEEAYPSDMKCKNGKTRLNCEKACADKICFGRPDAICRADSCDRCKIRFFDREMNELRCRKPVKRPSRPTVARCPSGSVLRKCSAEPCRRAVCEAYPKAICKANPCDNCKPMFFNNVGRRINCDPASLKGSCEEKCGVVRNETDGCHCDYYCSSRGDCCYDFKTRCESCNHRCGKYTPFATCQCTSDCRLKKNCCEDFADLCLASKTCSGRCNSPWRANEICQCHRRCVKRVNCCLDYARECA